MSITRTIFDRDGNVVAVQTIYDQHPGSVAPTPRVDPALWEAAAGIAEAAQERASRAAGRDPSLPDAHELNGPEEPAQTVVPFVGSLSRIACRNSLRDELSFAEERDGFEG